MSVRMEDAELTEERLRQEEEEQRWANETPEEAGLPDALPDAHIDQRFVIQRDGKNFVLYAGLLDMLHQISGGRFSVSTEVLQFPGEANGQTAVVSAVVSIWGAERENVPQRLASGIGDANPGNVSRAMQPHAIRMAETRAIARALRVITNIGMTALEELGDPGGAPATGRRPSQAPAGRTTRGEWPKPSDGYGAPRGITPANRNDSITVGGRAYFRPQLWNIYTERMDQVWAAKIQPPEGTVLKADAPLDQMAGATQRLRKALQDAGKLTEEKTQ